jgi:hypothetical protein
MYEAKEEEDPYMDFESFNETLLELQQSGLIK